ncbi:hypothetical protein CsatB_001560 [Cannabis sativa]
MGYFRISLLTNVQLDFTPIQSKASNLDLFLKCSVTSYKPREECTVFFMGTVSWNNGVRIFYLNGKQGKQKPHSRAPRTWDLYFLLYF